MESFIIDPEFRDKIPPLSAEEFSKLKENILTDGEVREPLVLWNNTIIDGHHRWRIIRAHPEIPYKVKRMEFPDKWAAIVWMCRNQLGRRNLTDGQKTYLIGKQYEAQKMTHGGDRKSEDFSKRQTGALNEDHPIASGIAREHGIGRKTVERSEYFSKGLDAAESASPGIRETVLSGQVKAPKNLISEIRNIPEECRAEAVEAIKRGDTDTAKAIVNRIPATPKAEPEVKPEERPKNVTKGESDDDRPAYNVDDFLGDLTAAVNNFEAALKQHMVLAHRDILYTQDGRDVADLVLKKAQKMIHSYFNYIDSVEKGVNKHGTKD